VGGSALKKKFVSFSIMFILILASYGVIDLNFEISTSVKAATIYVPADYPTIQKAIDAANPGDFVFVSIGSYYENIVIDKTITLIGEDKETTMIEGSPGKTTVWIKDVDGVKISGFNITGGPSTVGDIGISFEHANNCIITGNIIYGNFLGIWLHSHSSSNIIDGNLFFNNFRGLQVTSSNNEIINNDIFSNSNTGVWVHSSFIEITGNNILNNYHGIYLYDSYNISISHNYFIGNGVFITGHQLPHYNSHIIPVNNKVNDKPLYYYKDRNGLKIDNILAGELILVNCNNSNISNLTINNTDIGIEIAWSSNTSLIDNEVRNNHINGIYIESSTYSMINGNKLINNFMGIRMQISTFYYPCAYNILQNNEILNNSYGVMLGGCSNNSIRLNTISNNTISGIQFHYSFYNNITSNLVSYNEFGIYIGHYKSINNTIYHNVLINNNNQAFDMANNKNQWDYGYPSGGNYWSDYNGTDEYQGPAQNIPGNDGIGDTNYSIDANSRDNYPLMGQLFSYSVFLNQGWNLISIPLIHADENLKAVLTSIEGDYDAVQYFDSSDLNDPWKHYHTSKSIHLNDFNTIDLKMGFWIHITTPGGTTFVLDGIKLSSPRFISLNIGWNLVGYPSLTNHNRTVGLNNLLFNQDVNAIQWFDASTKSWHFMGPDDSFEVGRGYWIHSKVNTNWVVPL
jgi:parallel beta-helix repeat protein